jgi:hypothetical protein
LNYRNYFIDDFLEFNKILFLNRHLNKLILTPRVYYVTAVYGNVEIILNKLRVENKLCPVCFKDFVFVLCLFIVQRCSRAIIQN